MEKDKGFKRILFAVNASEHSAAAVPVVVAVAAASHADVRVLHVWSPNDARLGRHHEVPGVLQESALVDAIVDRLKAAGIFADAESSAAMSDQVASTIRDRADWYDADLIAIGNRGLSDLHNILVPSRTQQVLGQADRPVLAVRQTGHRAGKVLRRIVLALDGDADNACALQACVDLASPSAAEVEVIHFGNGNDPQIRAVVTCLADHGLTATWQRSPDHSHPADEIISAVARAKADIVIIGARQTAPWSIFVGDVTLRVLGSCPCPVLVSPRPGLTSVACTPLDQVDWSPASGLHPAAG